MIRLTVFLLLVLASPIPAQKDLYEKDVAFAVDEIGRAAEVLIDAKKIDWRKIGRRFVVEAGEIESHSDHLRLLVRLLARLNDGHAEVRPLDAGRDVSWPEEGPPQTGSGLLLSRGKKGLYVRGVFSTAAGLGIKPGWQILKIEGLKPADWLKERIALARDIRSFSTDQHAEFHTLQRGMVDRVGESWEFEFKTPRGKKTRKRLVFEKGVRQVPNGPVAYPGDPKDVRVSKEGNVRWTRLGRGHAYIHVRRSPGTVVDELDQALAELAEDAKGLILDYRNNTGGGFDHEAFMGRFIPEGRQLRFAKRYQGAGPKRFGGPIVVIVDGSTVSAGETGSGMFKEDGRAYMIGESATAGMSSQKTKIDLPSGLFSLRVSTRSNMGRFNEGRGIEGVGIVPHEIMQLDPKDLAQERDTLIRRAESLLRRFPKKSVPYDPKNFGWK